MGFRVFRVAAAGGIVAAAAFLPVSFAHAGTMSGDACEVTVASVSAEGSVLGEAVFPGEGATTDAPLPVDLEGAVDFSASSPVVFTSGTWSVSVAGTQVDSGTFNNKDGTQTVQESGISGTVPAAVSSSLTDGALVPVVVSVDAVEGACTASGYVTGVAPASSSPVFYAGAALALTGSALTGTLLLSKAVI